MPVIWSIKGEAGRSIDETERELGDLQMQGIAPEFNSLATDSISWHVWLKGPSSFNGLVPDYGQKITLYRNGDRYFTGHVTMRKPLFTPARYGYALRVEGPWWWLSKTDISSLVPDQTTVATERAAYVFPTGTVRTHLIALINRAIYLGLPISHGSIASTFAIPRLSVREMKFAQAFTELMLWVSDGILYFDYSGDDETYPALCMQRRTPATTITFNPAAVCMPKIDINPRQDLVVEELKVFYARRETIDNKRVTVWDSQVAGEVTSGLPRRELVTTSGPELDLWLPQDFTDSVVVRSAPIDVAAMLKQYDDRLRAAAATGFSVGGFTEPIISGTFTLPAVETRITDRDGNSVPGFPYYLTKGEVKDWWVKDGIEYVDTLVTATIWSAHYSPSPVPDGYQPTPPAWFDILGGQVWSYFVSDPFRAKWVYSTTISVRVPLVKKRWNADTTLIRSEDWAWFNPPAGLAENLLATRSHVPVEGDLEVVVDEVPAGNAVGCAVNVSGFTPETSNMRAMVSGYTVNLVTGQLTHRVSIADRLAFRELINRFRQSGADNIYYLVDSVSGDPGENPPADPELEVPVGPENALTFNGEYLTFDGEYITFTDHPETALTFGGELLTWNGEPITFTPDP